MNEDKKSIAIIIAETIDDFARSSDLGEILEEMNIYTQSHTDGAATCAFEWEGKAPKDTAKAGQILDFLNKIKELVINMGKETVEQCQPHAQIYSGAYKVSYRFRVWPIDGMYENFRRELYNK